jgi:hypothetical protein
MKILTENLDIASFLANHPEIANPEMAKLLLG